MAKLRRDTQTESSPLSQLPPPKPLRIIASGTLFLTHTLTIPNFPAQSSAVRARSVEKARGGSANMVNAHIERVYIFRLLQLLAQVLSVLAQFSGVEAVLVAPMAGSEEGKMITSELEREGINTHYCKVWPGAGVPTAWVLHSGQLFFLRSTATLCSCCQRGGGHPHCDQPQPSS